MRNDTHQKVGTFSDMSKEEAMEFMALLDEAYEVLEPTMSQMKTNELDQVIKHLMKLKGDAIIEGGQEKLVGQLDILIYEAEKMKSEYQTDSSS